jgi:Protein of unknown function (DUF664)
LVKHLVYMEQRWLRWGFGAEQLPDPYGDEDQAGRWQVEPGDTAADLVTALRTVGEQTRKVASEAGWAGVSVPGGRFSEDDPWARPKGWILVYVLHEYARHAGHLNIARELIDGVTGEKHMASVMRYCGAALIPYARIRHPARPIRTRGVRPGR